MIIIDIFSLSILQIKKKGLDCNLSRKNRIYKEFDICQVKYHNMKLRVCTYIDPII